MTFVHLHGHSQYSLLEGIGSVPNIIAQAKTLGMSAIAITDYFALYGALEFYQKATKAGIQPIIGVELPLVHDVSIKQGKLEHLGMITILANNRTGYQDLLKLVSYASTTGYDVKPRVDWATLSKYGSNLTVLIGGELSVLASQLHTAQDKRSITDLIARIYQTMDSRMILEYYVQDYDAIPVAREINTLTLQLAHDHGYTLTCSNNYHYITADEQEPFEIALAIRDQKFYHDRDRRKVLGHFHIMSQDEIRKCMLGHGLSDAHIDQIISTTALVASELVITMPPLPAMFPSYDPPAHIQQLYDQHQQSLIYSN